MLRLPPSRPLLRQWPAVSTSCRVGLSIAVPEQKPASLPRRRKTRPLKENGGTSGVGTPTKLAEAPLSATALPTRRCEWPWRSTARSSGRAARIRAGVQ